MRCSLVALRASVDACKRIAVVVSIGTRKACGRQTRMRRERELVVHNKCPSQSSGHNHHHSPPSDMSHPQSTHKSTKKRRPIRFVQVLRLKEAAISTSTKASNRQTTPRQLTRANSLLLNLYPCGLRSCCPAHSSQRTVLVRQSLIPLQKASFRCRSPSVL